ncbi:MAG: hypothetical protein IT426_05290 [Pirellulales bacterium]|nr:hypothetical protein [Pirellulales bacterium]
MSLRVATVHLVAATMLICPYLCMSEAAAAGRGTSALRKHSGCGCCSRSAPGDDTNGPGKSDSRQESGTCLCRGAVMDRHVVAADADCENVYFAAPDAIEFAGQPPIFGRSFFPLRDACHFPTADSGREVRALIASLLI